MKLVAALAVCLLWPLSGCVSAKRAAAMAPLPPGVTASGRAPVKGMFVHGDDSFVGEFWAYQTTTVGEVFALDGQGRARQRSGQPLTPTEPFVSPPSGKLARLVGCKPYSQNCRTMRIAGLKAVCDTFTAGVSADTCTSAGPGPSKGLILSLEVCGDQPPYPCSRTRVDAVIERALIDPVVFDDLP